MLYNSYDSLQHFVAKYIFTSISLTSQTNYNENKSDFFTKYTKLKQKQKF